MIWDIILKNNFIKFILIWLKSLLNFERKGFNFIFFLIFVFNNDFVLYFVRIFLVIFFIDGNSF